LLIVDVDLSIFFAGIWNVPSKILGRGWHLPHAPMSEATSMATLAADFDFPYIGKIFIPTLDFDLHNNKQPHLVLLPPLCPPLE
jgi:hypothetical protein